MPNFITNWFLDGGVSVSWASIAPLLIVGAAMAVLWEARNFGTRIQRTIIVLLVGVIATVSGQFLAIDWGGTFEPEGYSEIFGLKIYLTGLVLAIIAAAIWHLFGAKLTGHYWTARLKRQKQRQWRRR